VEISFRAGADWPNCPGNAATGSGSCDQVLDGTFCGFVLQHLPISCCKWLASGRLGAFSLHAKLVATQLRCFPRETSCTLSHFQLFAPPLPPFLRHLFYPSVLSSTVESFSPSLFGVYIQPIGQHFCPFRPTARGCQAYSSLRLNTSPASIYV
jgi:hypothetical protein